MFRLENHSGGGGGGGGGGIIVVQRSKVGRHGFAIIVLWYIPLKGGSKDSEEGGKYPH